MVVGICRIELRIHQAQSLKSKRQVLRRIKDRVKNKFNVSIAEVGENDKWQRALLGLALVGNDRRQINSALDAVTSYIENLNAAEIVNSDFEIINC
ncbi:MAG: DUF503 domain-containing protein [Deltaproteobacteria bacterium]|nr:MAG: DUF503 domain-containing protein [Deltaproteobacteria bacterium]